MAKTVIYTAVTGGYDELQPQVDQDIDVDWVCFSDDPDLKLDGRWRVIPLFSQGEHPRLTAKAPKCRPDVFLPEYERAVWIDANMAIVSRKFARETLSDVHDGIGVWRHPQRDCIYAEAEASLRLCPEKYGEQPIEAQVANYHREGHPKQAGLYACGTLARIIPDDHSIALGRMWLDECRQWSYQDQLSLPVVCRRLGVTPGIFRYRQIRARSLSNPWLSIHPHRRND